MAAQIIIRLKLVKRESSLPSFLFLKIRNPIKKEIIERMKNNTPNSGGKECITWLLRVTVLDCLEGQYRKNKL